MNQSLLNDDYAIHNYDVLKNDMKNRIRLISAILGVPAILGCAGIPQTNAATVWNGPTIIYTQPGTDPTQAANQDRITPNVWITRGTSLGIFNAELESGFAHFSSPVDTEWANGTLPNFASLTYHDWDTWAKNLNGGPPSTVGVNAVVHLISEDIYIGIKFTSWGERTGGFAYQRTTAPAAQPLTAPTVNKWMGVSAKEVMHGADPGAQLLKENLLGPTKIATEANVKTALADAGKHMDARLKVATARGVTIDAQTPVYDALTTATGKLSAPTDAAFQKQIDTILDKIETRYPDLSRLKPTDAHALKVELGDAIKWQGVAADTPINQVFKDIYRDINDAIKTNVHGIAPVQQRWGNLYIASRNIAESLAEDVVGRGSGPITPVAPPASLSKWAAAKPMLVREGGKWVVKAAIGGTAAAAGYRLFKELP